MATDAPKKSARPMTDRTRAMAVLHYEPYDRLPIVHFGFWDQTLEKWAAEGHISQELARNWDDGNVHDAEISRTLGFDFNWGGAYHAGTRLWPAFERKVVEEFADGSRHVFGGDGVVILEKPGAVSIPTEIRHTLVDRKSWEEHYKWRLQFMDVRVTESEVRCNDRMLPWTKGGLEFLQKGERDYPYPIYCGSLYGFVRNIVGFEGICYMQADDPELYTEIIDTVGELCYTVVSKVLATGAKFDFGHFWEDICFKNGPCVAPKTFYEKVGPHYKRITDLLKAHGIDIVSLDCDGCIDALIPTWIDNGVNTMFPIEVGTWDANITPWREKYGRRLRGVGGMNKVVFTRDRAAVDAEIERLKPQVELGGFIPCPDHRLAPDSKWENVLYYTERMRKVFA